jgi:hypothetical protein
LTRFSGEERRKVALSPDSADASTFKDAAPGDLTTSFKERFSTGTTSQTNRRPGLRAAVYETENMRHRTLP